MQLSSILPFHSICVHCFSRDECVLGTAHSLKKGKMCSDLESRVRHRQLSTDKASGFPLIQD